MVRLLTDAETDAILKLYIGYYGRAPETSGFNYWANEIMGQGSLNVDQSLSLDARVAAISDKFYNDAFEFSANVYYRGMSQEDFIKAAYLNALGRGANANTAEGRAKAPVAEEINYWKGKLDSGDVSYSGLILRFMSEAEKFKETDDFGFMSRLNANRIAVAREFVKPAVSGGLSGNAAINAGVAALANIDATARTGDVLKEYATTQVSTIGGSTLSLTNAADLLGPDSPEAKSLTTARADTIYAPTSGFLGDADIIDGGAGNDTIIATWAANAVDLNPTLSNIENLHLTVTGAAAGTVDAKDVSTEVRVKFPTADNQAADQVITVKANLGTKITAEGGATSSAGVAPNVVVTNRSDLIAEFAGATGAADAATIGLRGATLGELTVANIETLTLDGTSANSTVTTLTADKIETLTVTGDKAVTVGNTLTLAGTDGNTVDTSGSTGKVTLDVSGGDKKITATAGSGGLVLTTGSKADTLTGGAGDDEFTSGGGDDTLTGNAGDDKFTIGAGDDTVNGGAGNDTIIVAVGELDKDDTVNGGDGTDTLIFNDLTATSTVKAKLSGANAATLSSIEEIGTSADVAAAAAGAAGTAGTNAITADFNDFSQNVFVSRGTVVGGIAGPTNADATTKAGGAGVAVINAASGDALRLEGTATGGVGSAGAAANANDNGGAGGAGVDIGMAAVAGVAGTKSFSLSLLGAANITGGNGGAQGQAAGSQGAGGAGLKGSNVNTLNLELIGNAEAAVTATIQGGEIGGGGTRSAGVELAGNATINLTSSLVDAAKHKHSNLTFTSKNAINVNGADFEGILNVTGTGNNNDVLTGGAKDDALTGGDGQDVLTGNAGKDVLNGGANNDSINGGAGVDTITGGIGQDLLTGGDGADIFVFATATDSESDAADAITDFNTGGSDILRLGNANNVADAVTTALAAATAVQVSVGGKATFHADDDTLAEKLIALAADADIGNNEVVFFEDGSDSYIYGAGTDTANAAADFVIKLANVTGLTTLTENPGGGDFTIA